MRDQGCPRQRWQVWAIALACLCCLGSCIVSPQPEPEYDPNKLPLVRAENGEFGGSGECLDICAPSSPPECYRVCEHGPDEIDSCLVVEPLCEAADPEQCSDACIEEQIDPGDCPNIVVFQDEHGEPATLCVIEETSRDAGAGTSPSGSPDAGSSLPGNPGAP